MIRGYFREVGGRISPYLVCNFEFPDVPHIGMKTIELLVDTGSDRTTLSRPTAENIGLELAGFPDGGTSSGIGGVSAARQVRTHLSVQDYSTSFWLRILESRHPAPSILGRDFIRRFALFMEESSGRVLFLDQADIETYGLAALGSP